jgi:hypothetical protein
METDGGGWTQLYDQDTQVAPGYAPTDDWQNGINIDEPNMGHYSILHLIAEFEGQSPGFEFLLDWPQDGGGFVQWTQSEEPFVGRGVVTTIAQFPTNQFGCTAFDGLAADNDGSSATGESSTLDGSTNECWWWAIGTTGPQYGGIPAYNGSDAGGRLSAAQTRLWVR